MKWRFGKLSDKNRHQQQRKNNNNNKQNEKLVLIIIITGVLALAHASSHEWAPGLLEATQCGLVQLAAAALGGGGDGGGGRGRLARVRRRAGHARRALLALLGVLGEGACGRLLHLGGALLLADYAHDLMEGLVDIDGRRLGARLYVGYVEHVGQLLALLLRHLPQVDEIDLVCDEYHRILVFVLDAQYERVKVLHVHEAGAIGHRVDEQEGVALAHVLFAHGRELLLAGRVQHVEYAPLAVDVRVLDVRVLDGRVVVLDEHLLKELYGERRLADAAVADHHYFVRGQIVAIGRMWHDGELWRVM